MPTARELVDEQVRAVAEVLRTAAGLARMGAREVELAGDLSGCGTEAGEVFMSFAGEL